MVNAENIFQHITNDNKLNHRPANAPENIFSSASFSLLLISIATTTSIIANASDSLVILCSFIAYFLHFPGVRLKGYDIIRMINFIFVVRHPQHSNILIANIVVN